MEYIDSIDEGIAIDKVNKAKTALDEYDITLNVMLLYILDLLFNRINLPITK